MVSGPRFEVKFAGQLRGKHGEILALVETFKFQPSGLNGPERIKNGWGV